MTVDLAGWLLEGIAEDEEAATQIEDFGAEARESRGARDLEWQWLGRYGNDLWCLCTTQARVLAECAAKRRIAELHYHIEEWQACPICIDEGGEMERWPCHTLRLLAAPYADRPGYRAEWAPE